MLKVENIKLSFGGIKAIDDVSFDVSDGEILGIIGPNGSGKTSLFNVITGIYKPDSGKVLLKVRGASDKDKGGSVVDGIIDISGMSPFKIAKLGIARTFQNIKLFSYLTVLDNILLGRHIYFKGGLINALFGRDKQEYRKNRERVEEIIDFVDLRAYRYSLARDIPLGVRKKVELARALAMEPKILLLDEPTSGLTYEEKSEFLYYVKEINEKFGITIIVIEHDVKVITSISARVIALDQGKKIAEGKPDEVLKNQDVIKSYIGM